jgi:O-antigen/teichoic acid export membrane protein
MTFLSKNAKITYHMAFNDSTPQPLTPDPIDPNPPLDTLETGTPFTAARNHTYRFLRWTERFTGTDMLYVTKGSFWLSAGQMATSLTAFLLSIAFAHYLSKESFGTYKYVLSVTGLIGSLALNGLGTAVTRAIAKGADAELMKGFWLNVRWSAVVTLAAWVVAIYYFLQGNSQLGISFLIVGGASPLLDSAELYNAFLSGKKDFRRASIYRSIRALIASVVIFIAILFTNNPIALIATYFAVHTITALTLFILTYQTGRLNTIHDPETRHLAKHLSAISFLATAADQVDDILVFHFFGPVQLAIYNYAVAIPNNLLGFVKQIGILATPKYVTQDKALAQKTLLFKSLLLCVSTLPVVLVYVITAPYIFQWFFPQYIMSVTYTQIYSVVLLVSAALPVAFLDAHTAIKEKYIISVASNVFKLVALAVGVWFFGLWGAIGARIISKLFGVSLSFIAALRI